MWELGNRELLLLLVELAEHLTDFAKVKNVPRSRDRGSEIFSLEEDFTI